MTLSVFELSEKMDAEVLDCFVRARRMFGSTRDRSASTDYEAFVKGGAVPKYVMEYIQYQMGRTNGHFL